MKSVLVSLACLISCMAVRAYRPTPPDVSDSGRSFTDASVGQSPTGACVPPAQVAATPEETAWRLFVAAACPVNAGRYPFVTWENWIEQGQLYGPALTPGAAQRFHASPLRTVLSAAARGQQRTARDLLAPAPSDCGGPSSFGRTICEETRINPDAEQFIRENTLTTVAGQRAFAQAGKTFNFRPAAVEVKVDWIELPACQNPPAGVHVETVAGKCYALAGMHVISKLIDKWIWATFEPQNSTTNPRRCQALGCKDAWGSSPATTSGTSTQLTTPLRDLMTAAQLAPEWSNYRLDGVQTDFLSGGAPTVLGNSIIEGENAGDPSLMNQSSCITCHQFSTIRTDGRPGMGPSFRIGNPLPLPAGMIPRDFVWSLDLAR